MPYDQRKTFNKKQVSGPLLGTISFKERISDPYIDPKSLNVNIEKPAKKNKVEPPKYKKSRLVPQHRRGILMYSFADGTRPSREVQEKEYLYSIRRLIK